MREEFYTQCVQFKGGPRRNVVVLLLRCGNELAGMFSCECDFDTLSVYARLSVAAVAHRGSNLAQVGTAFAEALGRRMGMGMGACSRFKPGFSSDSPG